MGGWLPGWLAGLTTGTTGTTGTRADDAHYGGHDGPDKDEGCIKLNGHDGPDRYDGYGYYRSGGQEGAKDPSGHTGGGTARQDTKGPKAPRAHGRAEPGPKGPIPA